MWPQNTSHVFIPRTKIDEDEQGKHGCFIDVALGLQHALALDTEGRVYTWGKNARGQCGNVREEQDVQKDASRTTTAVNATVGYHNSPTLVDVSHVEKIASGFHMSVALSKNQVYIWGKNVLLEHDKAQDADVPVVLGGLPNKKILDVACTSHSTSILLEDGSVWGYGVTTDTAKLTPEPICILPPNILTFPIRDFYASFDRTYVVCQDQVLELQLWSDGFEKVVPVWLGDLEGERVKFVRRGWLHTVIVTEVDE